MGYQSTKGRLEGKKPRALLFCRSYLVPDFRACFEPLSHHYDFVVLTDGKRKGERDTRKAFYKYLADGPAVPKFLSAEEINDCIDRCRLLRHLPRPKAENQLRAMAATLQDWYSELKPDIVISHLVDDYVTHLVCILSRKRGIPYFAYTQAFFPGFVQLFRHENGSPLICYEPEDQEVDRVISAISRSRFRQDYSNPKTYSPLVHLYRVARYGVKRVVFWLKGVIEKDPLQTHYAVTPYLAERRRLGDYPPADLFRSDWREFAAQAPRPLIYFALSYFPEATTDYWVENKSMLRFDDKVASIVGVLARHFTLVVKEHPHMMGMRRPSLYKVLGAIPGVILVPPMEFSSEVMAQCDAVIIGAGSGGVESVLRGLPIFTYCNTSYWFGPSGAHFLDLDNVEAWPAVIHAGLEAYLPLNEDARRSFVKACLSTTVPTRDGGKVWPLMDALQTEKVLKHLLQ